MKDTKENLKFIWNYVKYEKKAFITQLICHILSTVISLVIPVLSAQAIVKLTENNFYQLLFISFIICITENIRNIIQYYNGKSSQILYRETLIRLQYDLGKHILMLDNQTIDKNGTGVFSQRIMSDTGNLSDVYAVIINDITELLTNIGIFTAIFIINKVLFAYLILEVVLIYLIERIKTNKGIEKDKEIRKESEKVNGFISEMIRGMKDIKMLNSEEPFLQTMKSYIYKQNQARYYYMNVYRKYTFIRGTVIDLTEFIQIALLVLLLVNQRISVAHALVIHNFAGRLPYMTNIISSMMETIKEFNLSSSRVRDIIDGKNFKKEYFGTKHLNHVNGDFEFKNVYFSYDSDKLEVLKNISFKVNANETVAFVGKSGAGKTTIFSLLCKMYDINSGKITIDGIDIKELDKDSIRGNITIISQNPYIFNLSIKENLKLVKKNVTNKEIKEACKLACLDEFIESLPDKYDTVVGEGGVTLSGGQRQRLAIARALIQKTEIILFDEATSALDNETQSKIQKAIENLQGEYTILIIAHRLSTILNADRILLVDKGKIVAEGTHKELLTNNKIYKKLYENEIKINN